MKMFSGQQKFNIYNITTTLNEVVQHVEYVPFGEVFIEERNNTWNTPYLFNSKELDEETGLYYYGARYYEPRVSVWYGTDPMQEKYPGVSSYAYCLNNPVKFIDPTGMDWVENNETSDITWNKNVTSADNTPEGFTYRGTSYQREKIWTNQIVKGNSESGLMQEIYNSDGNMTYKNLTPWIDVAFEEFNKGIVETGSNPEIIKYWEYTQMPAVAANPNHRDTKYAQAVMKSDKESWCASFVNWVLETSGISGTMHAKASSFQGWGQNLETTPVYGAIVYMNYSHVGFVVGQNPNGSIVLLGGNQPGDAVNLNPTGRAAINQSRYPIGYIPTTLPLPQMNVQRGSMNYGNTR
jgi:uncharacterized protein (TIGR02594 family)